MKTKLRLGTKEAVILMLPTNQEVAQAELSRRLGKEVNKAVADLESAGYVITWEENIVGERGRSRLFVEITAAGMRERQRFCDFCEELKKESDRP